WKALLSNASNEEVATKFWRHCKRFTLLPDINKSGNQFEVMGDKIVSPISIINGVGEKAYEQLVKHKPYTDFNQFMNIHMGPRDAKDRSAVHSGIVRKLIAAGVLDSMFPDTMSVEEKLLEFEKVKSTLKDEKLQGIPEEFIGITELGRYMVKKQLINIYSQDLRELILPHRGGRPDNNNKDWLVPMGGGRHCSIVEGYDIEWFKHLAAEGQGPQFEDVAVLAYVIDEKTKRYKNNSKQMTSLILDVNGTFYEEVLWPPYEGDIAESGFKGLIVIVQYYGKYSKIGVRRVIKIVKHEDLEKYNMV
ncbi:MAG: hypothetical protein ACREGB_02195, partial [Candidatus Saccharimonadales bacterium]